jgi:hypothetical protein
VIALVLAGAVLALGFGCADEQEPPLAARRSFLPFRMDVYPVLLSDCGFPACHGAPERFFRVYGPGRTRLPNSDGTLPEAFDTSTVAEQELTYQLALSMIDERNRSDSLLLRKPLAVEAGGSGHLGVDSYGRDVYRTTQDAGYVKLARWVFSDPPMAMMPGATGGMGGGAGGMGGTSGTTAP